MLRLWVKGDFVHGRDPGKETVTRKRKIDAEVERVTGVKKGGAPGPSVDVFAP